MLFRSLVVKYLIQEVSKDELEEVLREVLSKETVEDKYVRDFLNCQTLDKYSQAQGLDKLLLIRKYGSKKAKQIAVDEMLKRR